MEHLIPLEVPAASGLTSCKRMGKSAPVFPATGAGSLQTSFAWNMCRIIRSDRPVASPRHGAYQYKQYAYSSASKLSAAKASLAPSSECVLPRSAQVSEPAILTI